MAAAPSLRDAANALATLSASETRRLVFELGVSLRDLDDIASDYQDSATRQIHFIRKWLDIDPEASWKKLASGLRQIGKIVLAAKLESQYVQAVTDPPAESSTGSEPPVKESSALSIHVDLQTTLETQLKRYTKKAKPTEVILGSGTYGSVIELVSGRETVAGKVFRVSATAQLHAIATKVCGEVITMLQLNHPNIVQCKGVSLLPDKSPLPVLLMERLMTSLHAYLLDPDNSNLPVERKVSFLLDTARGLDYLHSLTPAIIHRDLTATNVLLTSELRAKITDFGNSRIMDLDPNATPMIFTSIPGTLEYMPPESTQKYNSSLDVFSFGHLSLFTVTQTQIIPLPATFTDQDTGVVHGRTELQRRVKYVEKSQPLLSSGLLQLIQQCLHNLPGKRPTTKELVAGLSSDPSSLSHNQVSGRVVADSGFTENVEEKEEITETQVSPPLIPVSTSSTQHQMEQDTSAEGERLKPSDKQLLWMGSATANAKPTLPQLMRLNIPERVGVACEKFGFFLLDDKNGDQVAIIKEDSKHQTETIVTGILRKWIQERPTPVTWDNLIAVLRNIKLSTLADDVRKHHREILFC